MDLAIYGYDPISGDMETINSKVSGIPARIIAVHRDRYGLVSEYGECFGRLKTSNYYGENAQEFSQRSFRACTGCGRGRGRSGSLCCQFKNRTWS